MTDMTIEIQKGDFAKSKTKREVYKGQLLLSINTTQDFFATCYDQSFGMAAPPPAPNFANRPTIATLFRTALTEDLQMHSKPTGCSLNIVFFHRF